jgi:hypothetical protein
MFEKWRNKTNLIKNTRIRKNERHKTTKDRIACKDRYAKLKINSFLMNYQKVFRFKLKKKDIILFSKFISFYFFTFQCVIFTFISFKFHEKIKHREEELYILRIIVNSLNRPLEMKKNKNLKRLFSFPCQKTLR